MTDDLSFLPFDTDNREFVRGFQMGLVYGRWCSDEAGDVVVYAESAEMLARMIERGELLEVEINGDEWLTVRRMA